MDISLVTQLTCWACGTAYPADRWRNLCDCGKPLRVDYDLPAVGRAVSRDDLAGRTRSLWRWREVLPLPLGEEPLTLGEGGTPLLAADGMGEELGMKAGALWVKDEAVNPTGSFKARGMAVAVAMARHFGARKLAVPSAGNAGGALAAYAARAGIEAICSNQIDFPPRYQTLTILAVTRTTAAFRPRSVHKRDGSKPAPGALRKAVATPRAGRASPCCHRAVTVERRCA